MAGDAAKIIAAIAARELDNAKVAKTDKGGKGSGVAAAGCTADLFLHRSALACGAVSEGDVVEFERGISRNGKVCAIKCRPSSQPPPQVH